MKKILIASVLGLAGSVATSFGQGVIQFNNYSSFHYNPVIYQNGNNVNSGTVELALFYALGTYADLGSFMTAASQVGTTFIDTTANQAGAYGGTGPGGYYQSS